MLDIRCRRCKASLDVPGGIVFSPPNFDSQCAKAHVCALCYTDLMTWLATKPVVQPESIPVFNAPEIHGDVTM